MFGLEHNPTAIELPWISLYSSTLDENCQSLYNGEIKTLLQRLGFHESISLLTAERMTWLRNSFILYIDLPSNEEINEKRKKDDVGFHLFLLLRVYIFAVIWIVI